MVRRPLACSWLPPRRGATAGSLRAHVTVLALEERSVPAALSIADASATEGGNTLKFLDRFISSGSGGLSVANGSTLGADGNQYVADGGGNSILRYDGVGGSFKDVFVTPGSGGL